MTKACRMEISVMCEVARGWLRGHNGKGGWSIRLSKLLKVGRGVVSLNLEDLVT